MGMVVFLLFLSSFSARAAERSFIGNDADWSITNNWSDGRLPGSGDTGIIAGTEGNVRTARFYAGGDLAGPPDAIHIQPYGVLGLWDTSMATEHNLILEGGRFMSLHNRSAETTISLRSDSYISTSGRYGTGNSLIYTLTLNGIIQDYGAEAGQLIVDRGQVYPKNSNNTYSGGTQIRDEGSLWVVVDNSLGTGPVELLDGGTLEFRTVSLRNPIILNGGRLRTVANYTLNSTNWIKGWGEIYSSAGSASIRGPIYDFDAENPGCLVKTGSGRIFITSATNTYSGGTLVKEGMLVADGSANPPYTGQQAFGTGDLVVTNGAALHLIGIKHVTAPGATIFILSNATVRFHTPNFNKCTTNVLVRKGGNMYCDGAGIIGYYTSYDSILLEGCVNLHRYQGVRGGYGYNHWYGTFSDGEVPGQLAIVGTNSGLTELRGTYTYTGGTIIRDGGPDAAELTLAGDGRMPDTGVILVESNAVMNFNNITDTVGGLAGVGSVWLGSGTVNCNEGISPGIDAYVAGTLSITGSTGRVVLEPSAVSTFYLRTPGDHDQVVLQGGAGLTLGGTLKIEKRDILDEGSYTLFELTDGAAPDGMFTDIEMPEGSSGRVKVIGNDVVLNVAKQGSVIVLR